MTKEIEEFTLPEDLRMKAYYYVSILAQEGKGR